MIDNYRFKVNLGGMIDILANHLYSSPNVFVRELLQNGIDAIKARQKIDSSSYQGKIKISLQNSKEDKIIIFKDNGIGLKEEEIHSFLSIIGQSSKRDLLNGDINNDYIGRFGIGLLSCFMISDEISVITKSYKDNQVHQWIGKPDGTYSIKKIVDNTHEYGTTIYLKCKKETIYYFDDEILTKLVRYYGQALPFPIFFSYEQEDKLINNEPILWDSLYLSHDNIMMMGERIFNERFLDYIPIKSKTGQVNGVAYIISHKVSSNVKNNHRVYLKNMLLTEKSGNILPEWAFFIKCVINTDMLRPTASRESFYEDNLLDTAREEISQCIMDYFIKLEDKNHKLLSKIIETHDLAIKSLAVEHEELFKVFFDYIKFQTSFGLMTGKEIRMETNMIPYSDTVDHFRQISPLFAAQKKLFVNGGYIYIKELLEMLPNIYSNLYVELIDSYDLLRVMEDLTDKEEIETEILISEGTNVLKEFFCSIEIRHFKPTDLSSIYIINQDALFYKEIINNKEESNHKFSNLLDNFIPMFKEAAQSVLYLNYDNPVIQKLIKLTDKKALKNCIELLYAQSLMLGHYPLQFKELQILNKGIISMIEWGLNKWQIN